MAHWLDLTARDFTALDPEKTVVVLPIAAIEQHGPHLAVGTDTIIAQGMVDATIARLAPDEPVVFLPVQSIGKSDEHLRSSGTLTLSAETAIRLWTEIGESVARAGLRKLIIVNAHGGNVEVMGIVARELRVKHQMLVVQCAWRRFGLPDGVFSAEDTAHGIHGGDYETSLMLHLSPQHVRMAQAENFVPRAVQMERDYKRLRLTGPTSFAWISEDNHPEGVAGEAHLASAAKGAAAMAHQVDAFLELIEDVTRFPLSDLAE